MAVSQRGAWREWVAFFLEGIAQQAEDTLERAKALQDLQTEWEKKLQSQRASALTLQVLREFFEALVLSPNALTEKLQISHQAAMKILRRLEAMEMVQEQTEHKRDRLYAAMDIIKLLR